MSVDSFAVSVGYGCARKSFAIGQSAKIATFLAVFQGLMPVVGWLVGASVKQHIQQFDHWIAFLLLGILGVKMIFEKAEDETRDENLKLKEIILMSFGTSIDALVVGFSFAFLEVNIWMATLIIGVTTFLFSMFGMKVGEKSGQLLGQKAMIFGGIILVALGGKILIEHLVAGV